MRKCQLINLEKSSVFFSKNTTDEKKGQIYSKLLNIKVVTQRKYLRLLMVITRSKEQVFGFVRDKVGQRLKNWKTKSLSTVGKSHAQSRDNGHSHLHYVLLQDVKKTMQGNK